MWGLLEKSQCYICVDLIYFCAHAVVRTEHKNTSSEVHYAIFQLIY